MKNSTEIFNSSLSDRRTDQSLKDKSFEIFQLEEWEEAYMISMTLSREPLYTMDKVQEYRMAKWQKT